MWAQPRLRLGRGAQDSPRAADVVLVGDPATSLEQFSEASGIAELYRFALLAGVDPEVLSDLWRRSRQRLLAPGEELLVAGKDNRCLYLVLAGELGVHLVDCGDSPIAIIKAGETVGELSVLDRSSACADVRAVGPTRVLEVSEDAFWQLIAESHGFALNLLVRLAARLRANNEAVSETARQHDQMRQVALFDALTGIHNRRWFDETFPRLVARARHDHAPLALLVIDVDHFKQFNDRHGHPAGDAVLRKVAEVLSRSVRPTDLVARYGGEEFVVLLPTTNLEGARIVGERLRRAVAACDAGAELEAALPQVTISVGIADLAETNETPAALLGRADRALYRAKAGGRNQVA